eukprot:GHVN01015281.1.p1 GENE.GHVN01015281.1~~GHVN01015281.1.p1  ORF type:complete len:448 (+),score=9.69 GHVN01015281.1:51-1346(+)
MKNIIMNCWVTGPLWGNSPCQRTFSSLQTQRKITERVVAGPLQPRLCFKRPDTWKEPDITTLTSEDFTRRFFRHQVPLKANQANNRSMEFTSDVLLEKPTVLHTIDLLPIGRLQVVQGCLFHSEADVIVVPMVPNFLPTKGIGLEVLERGGPELAADVFPRVKLPTKPGQVILSQSTYGVAPNAKQFAFVVIPFYYQGNSFQAGRSFRQTLRRCFNALAMQSGVQSIALPHLGGGVAGYEPRSATTTIVEEAIEALTQLDSVSPSYNLKSIILTDIDPGQAGFLHFSALQVESRRVPAKRVVSADEYFAQKRKRLLKVPGWAHHFSMSNKHLFIRNNNRIFKRPGKVFRKFFKPFLYRRIQILRPRPLLVRESDGKPSDLQLPPSPLYKRGVSSTMWPHKSSGLPGVTFSRGGTVRGVQKRQVEGFTKGSI